PVDLQDVGALSLTVSPGFHQPHNPSHAPTPDQRSDAKLPLRHPHPQSPGSPKADHRATCGSLAETGEQGVECQGEGSAGEELIAIDQIEQRHRFAAQGMDDVTIVDDMTMFAVRLGPTAP